MPFRRTASILTDSASADPAVEADVIMTAAVAGFTANQLTGGTPVRFDMNPTDATSDPPSWDQFRSAVDKIGGAVEAYLRAVGHTVGGKPVAGVSPAFDRDKGGVIVGVYGIAGQRPPASMNDPKLTPKGQRLYDEIRQDRRPQYVGIGAYTGFVDNPNTEGNTDPVGPRSTARFLMPEGGADGSTQSPVHRWLPAPSSRVWGARLRRGTTDDYVPWGLIGGELAKDPAGQGSSAPNRADELTALMHSEGMQFVGTPTTQTVSGYTHGMVQAIYKAYSLGPACTPYEIAVGTKTTKLASCFPCTMFMTALGYPPTSTHLGRGESWAPLYQPYNPDGGTEPHEAEVLCDLNSAWAEACDAWLRRGIEVLGHARVAPTHQDALAALRSFADAHPGDPTLGGTLILDALTIHQTETRRIDRTLQARS